MIPHVAIVILNWNGVHYLRQFLPSIIASTYSNYTIVLADNASTDESIQFVREHYPSVEIVALAKNFGFAKGYNEALKKVQSDYYVLLNSDVEVEAGWIEPIIDLMEGNKSVGACQPKLLMYADKQRFEYAGAAGGWIDNFGYPFARGRVFDFCEEDKGQYNDNVPVFWASGAALFIRASLYHEVGGLDEYFFAHQEEIDLCWRLQLAGYRIMAVPASTVYHVGGGTLPKGNERKVLLNFRNNLIMLAKNLPRSEAWWKLPCRFLLDVVSAFKSAFSGQFIYFKAIGEAHIGFLRWLFFNRRKSVFPKNRNGIVAGRWSKSVIWAHFIQGKKSFAEIVDNK